MYNDKYVCSYITINQNNTVCENLSFITQEHKQYILHARIWKIEKIHFLIPWRLHNAEILQLLQAKGTFIIQISKLNFQREPTEFILSIILPMQYSNIHFYQFYNVSNSQIREACETRTNTMYVFEDSLLLLLV